ncbi:SDR family oxidoreductase [Vibrio sp. S4M6]|uniref:SDR family oxidoreductase n=1 Tax=Vibrio sinus TaxID=2946865 RepID=UPI00202A0D8E|nr:SDR family oxidoreductase [Vibrio sinus]MCL9782649.1 SDR family oxidoreductase [Vibrio sinus]
MSLVFITGAGRGIGLTLAKWYLDNGWQVHATYRNEQSARELLSLEQANASLTCHCLDVTDYHGLSNLTAQLPPIDLLINNAGYYGPSGYSLGETDIEEWRKVLETNTIAPLKIVETLLPLLRKGQVKKIACLSSKVGSMTDNTSGRGYIYRSSKAALNSVVKSLSIDLAPEGIIVLALHPGWVQTKMGGPNALISTERSVEGLAQVIDSATTENSGQFINFDGSAIPW